MAKLLSLAAIFFFLSSNLANAIDYCGNFKYCEDDYCKILLSLDSLLSFILKRRFYFKIVVEVICAV